MKRKREEDNKGPKQKKQRTEGDNANKNSSNKSPKNSNQNKGKNASQNNKNNAANASKPANNSNKQVVIAPKGQKTQDKVFEKMQGVLGESTKDIDPRKQKMFEKRVS